MEVKSEHGTVTLLFTVVLVPVLIFCAIFVDGSRYYLSNEIKDSAERATINSELANFDKQLKNVYGLFATDQTMSSLGRDIARNAQQGGEGPINASVQQDAFAILNTNLGNVKSGPPPIAPDPIGARPSEPRWTRSSGMNAWVIIFYHQVIPENLDCSTTRWWKDYFSTRTWLYFTEVTNAVNRCDKYDSDLRTWNAANAAYMAAVAEYQNESEKWNAANKAKSQNLVKVAATADNFQLKSLINGNMANADVLRQNVVDYSKYYAPADYINQLLSVFNAYKTVNKNVNSITDITNGMTLMNQLVDHAGTAVSKLNELNTLLGALALDVDTFQKGQAQYPASTKIVANRLFYEKALDEAINDKDPEPEIIAKAQADLDAAVAAFDQQDSVLQNLAQCLNRMVAAMPTIRQALENVNTALTNVENDLKDPAIKTLLEAAASVSDSGESTVDTSADLKTIGDFKDRIEDCRRVIAKVSNNLASAEYAGSALTSISMKSIEERYLADVHFENVSKVEDMPDPNYQVIFNGASIDDLKAILNLQDQEKDLATLLDTYVNASGGEMTLPDLDGFGPKTIIDGIVKAVTSIGQLTTTLGAGGGGYLDKYPDQLAFNTAEPESETAPSLDSFGGFINLMTSAPATIIDLIGVLVDVFENPASVRDNFFIADYISNHFNNASLSVSNGSQKTFSGVEINNKLNRGSEVEYILDGSKTANNTFWRTFMIRFTLNFISAMLVPSVSKIITNLFGQGIPGIILGILVWVGLTILESLVDMIFLVAQASAVAFIKTTDTDWSTAPKTLGSTIQKLAMKYTNFPPKQKFSGNQPGPNYTQYCLIYLILGLRDEGNHDYTLLRMSNVIQSHFATTGTLTNLSYSKTSTDAAEGQTDNGFRMRHAYSHLTINANYETIPLLFKFFPEELGSNDMFSNGYKIGSKTMLGY